MRGILLVLVASASLIGAEQTVWDHLPWATYSEEQLDLAVRLPSGWSLHGPSGRLELDADHGLHLPAAGLEHIVLRDAADAVRGGIRLLRPGDGGALSVEHGRLMEGDELVVLTLSRLEHIADRRWMVLRPSRRDPLPCRTSIQAPEVELGESGLLAQIADARTQAVWKEGVLVHLPASDRHVGWNHRAYRQTLAWFVADLWRRGAARVVLVQPPVPAAELDQIRPLWAQVRDVGHTYRCSVLEVEPLSDHQYWQLGQGLLGDTLNAGGRAALAERCAPFLAAAD